MRDNDIFHTYAHKRLHALKPLWCSGKKKSPVQDISLLTQCAEALLECSQCPERARRCELYSRASQTDYCLWHINPQQAGCRKCPRKAKQLRSDSSHVTHWGPFEFPGQISGNPCDWGWWPSLNTSTKINSFPQLHNCKTSKVRDKYELEYTREVIMWPTRSREQHPGKATKKSIKICILVTWILT